MATYDSPRSEVKSNLTDSVGGYLAQQILAALDEGNSGQAESIGIQTGWKPGDAVNEGTGILIVEPGSVSGNVTVPDNVSALLFTGSSNVQATLAVSHDIGIVLTDGADAIRIVAPSEAAGETISVDLGAGNDRYEGAANVHNNVIGGLGDDTMIGGNLRDAFDVGQGNDTVDAGGGYDTAYVRGSLSDYTESYNDGVLTLVNKATNEVTVLQNLEYVTFEKGGVIINVTTESGFAAASLYEVILDRATDSGGHEFYSQKTGTELVTIAEDLLHSPEFTAKYGMAVDDMSDTKFVDTMYHTAFQRDGDAEGEKYWIDKLASGMSRGEVATRFAYSVEAQEKFDGTINFDHDHTTS